jgi:hypothetical protein
MPTREEALELFAEDMEAYEVSSNMHRLNQMPAFSHRYDDPPSRQD